MKFYSPDVKLIRKWFSVHRFLGLQDFASRV